MIYRASKFYADKIITLRYYYTTQVSFIAAYKVADHIKKIDLILDDNGLTIYKPLKTQTDPSTNAFIIVILLIAAGAYVARKKFNR